MRRFLGCVATAAIASPLALAACERAERPADAAGAASSTARGSTTARIARVTNIDLGRFFGDEDVAFVLLDAETGHVRVHGADRAGRRLIPASTFKIASSLIALETGVSTGPDFTLPWDSLKAPRQPWWPSSWTRTQTMRSAFRNSVVWYYQELVRGIGAERMQAWLDRFGYGNRDMSGGLERFWLDGGLAISAEEQVEFLRRFYLDELGVSEASTAIMKDLLVLETGPGYRLSGKTGTAEITSSRELGWIVGYVEADSRVLFYALNMEGEQVWEDWPPRRRVELVRAILSELGVPTAYPPRDGAPAEPGVV